MQRLDVPTLWIGGSEDEALPETLAHFAQLAAGQLEVLPGGTHCVHLEQPKLYLSLIRRFLSLAPD